MSGRVRTVFRKCRTTRVRFLSSQGFLIFRRAICRNDSEKLFIRVEITAGRELELVLQILRRGHDHLFICSVSLLLELQQIRRAGWIEKLPDRRKLKTVTILHAEFSKPPTLPIFRKGFERRVIENS